MSTPLVTFNDIFTGISSFIRTAHKARALRKHVVEIKEIITDPEKRETLLPSLILSFGAIIVQNVCTEWWETKKISEISFVKLIIVIIVVASQAFVLLGRVNVPAGKRRAPVPVVNNPNIPRPAPLEDSSRTNDEIRAKDMSTVTKIADKV